MSWQDHHALRGIQWPSLVPTVFCQPVAIGGPGGLGLEFPAWPILVPGKEGVVQMCYTNDEQFRDTYLQRGFCGLDASFRAQFDYECPLQQVIQVALVVPATEEKQPDRVKERDEKEKGGEEKSGKTGWSKWKIFGCSVLAIFFLPMLEPEFWRNVQRDVKKSRASSEQPAPPWKSCGQSRERSARPEQATHHEDAEDTDDVVEIDTPSSMDSLDS
jgi:hypothetical protein